ncbi:MAG: siroheme synthase CysG [Rhizobiaceae bacterium]
MRPLEEQLSFFPVFFKVDGRVAVVVGDGEEALAKARLLSESRISIRLVSSSPSRELGAFIIQEDIEHLVAPFAADMLSDACLVFAATGNADLDERIVEAARQQKIPANAVDRPELCDFYTPALVNRAPVAVAIGSEGTGPVLTQIIRSKIETMLPGSTGSLARLAALYRDAVDRLIPRGAPRRRFWRAFFQGGVASAVNAGDVSGARRLATGMLKSRETETGYVSLVGAGPGASDLLTLRAQRLLQEADVIIYDRLVPETLVTMGRRDARRIPVGKAKGCHSVTQDEINNLLVEQARAGNRIVRLKSGDPLIFGRAGEEMATLRENEIDFEVVPGVTSALAAAAEAEIPLTLRGVASSIVFATGHDRNSETLPDWARLALNGTTIAVFMGRTVAAKIAAQLGKAGLSPETPVAIIESASTRDQKTYSGELSDLAKLKPGRTSNAPALILIGEAIRHGALENAAPILDTKTENSIAA